MGQEIIDTKGQEQLAVVRKLYADMWGRKPEKMALFMDDGKVFWYGKGNTNTQAIPMTFNDMLSTLTKNGKSFGNVTAIVHNHDFGKTQPSNVDVNFLDRASMYGFKGKYMVYDLAGQRLHEPTPDQIDLIRKQNAKGKK